MKMLSTVLCLLILVATVNCEEYYEHRVGIGRACSGCSVKDICYSKNQTWKEGCFTKRCGYYGFHFGWRTEIVKVQCRGPHGTCFDNGQLMYSNGKGSCYCNIDAGRARTSCGV